MASTELLIKFVKWAPRTSLAAKLWQ